MRKIIDIRDTQDTQGNVGEDGEKVIFDASGNIASRVSSATSLHQEFLEEIETDHEALEYFLDFCDGWLINAGLPGVSDDLLTKVRDADNEDNVDLTNEELVQIEELVYRFYGDFQAFEDSNF